MSNSLKFAKKVEKAINSLADRTDGEAPIAANLVENHTLYVTAYLAGGKFVVTTIGVEEDER